MWTDRVFLFHPTPYPDGDWDTSSLALPVADCRFAARDGTPLHAWHARNPNAAWTLLWCHGNTGNVSYRSEHLQLLCRRGWDVFLFDYRGYGRSAGTPSEEGFYQDAEAAYDHLTVEKKIPPERVVIFGQSLGGAIAVELALRRKGLALVLESTFTRLRDVVRRPYPLLPYDWFFESCFHSDAKIARVGLPLLAIHGTDDEIVPCDLGRQLFEAAAEPKWFYPIPGATHKDTFLVGGEAYYRRIEEFVEEARGRRA